MIGGGGWFLLCAVGLPATLSSGRGVLAGATAIAIAHAAVD